MCKKNDFIINMTTFIIGPSHIHDECMGAYLNIFTNTTLDGNQGRPNWSNSVLKLVSDNYHNYDQIIWMVSDFRFGNIWIDEIKSSKKLFLNKCGYPRNMSRSLINKKNDKILCDKSIKCIDYIKLKYPKIKLLFWCLYTRSKIRTSNLPKEFHYDQIKKRYNKNILDIDKFTSPEEFKSCIKDSGGHPNKKGYELLKKMINTEIFKNKIKRTFILFIVLILYILCMLIYFFVVPNEIIK